MIEDQAEAVDEVGKRRGRGALKRAIAIGDLDQVGADAAQVVTQRGVEAVGSLRVGAKSSKKAAQAAKRGGKIEEIKVVSGVDFMRQGVERKAFGMPAGDGPGRQR